LANRVFYPRASVVLDVFLWDEDRSRQVVTVPLEVTIDRNTLRKADTFSVTIAYSDFPVDARALRDVIVAIHMSDVGHAAGSLDIGSLKTKMIVGYADKVDTDLSGSAETIKFSGRDYTALFLDQEWDTSEMLDITGNLRQVMERFLERVPGTEDITLTFNDYVELQEPSLGATEPRLITKPGNYSSVVMEKVTFRPKWNSRGDKDDCWTVLNDLLDLVGVLPVVFADTLQIRTPLKFATQTISMHYGKDIESLRISRSTRTPRRGRIRVVSYDSETGERNEAEYPTGRVLNRPTKASGNRGQGKGTVQSQGSGLSNLATNTIRDKKTTPKGRTVTTETPVITFNVDGRFTVDELKLKAQHIYEKESREQITLKITTKELRTFDDQNLLTLANGSRIDVVPSNEVLSGVEGMNYSEALEHMTTGRNAISRDAAEVFLLSAKSVRGIASGFYVKDVTINWNITSGMSFDITAINYV